MISSLACSLELSVTSHTSLVERERGPRRQRNAPYSTVPPSPILSARFDAPKSRTFLVMSIEEVGGHFRIRATPS
jgi:hypothetical protein